MVKLSLEIKDGKYMLKRFILIILCLLNMMTITYFSSQNAEKSTEVSEGVTVKVVSSVTGQPEPVVKENIKEYDKYTRSFAHFFLFLTLGFLLYFTLREFNIKMSFLFAFAICFVYAIFDESYQKLLNQGRAFEAVDLIKDWSGSALGIFGAWLIQTKVKMTKKGK